MDTINFMDAAQPAPGRSSRRKERTRAALIAAAQQILATRGTTEVPVQDITDEADVGLGSFYNHFETKAELFEEAVLDLLADFGVALDEARVAVDDPAEMVAIGIRETCRLAGTRPEVARILALAGPHFLVADRGLAPRARRDVADGVRAGRFTALDEPLAVTVLAGSVLTFLQLRLHGEDLDDDDADTLAATVLAALGVPRAEAVEISRRPLPPLPAPPDTPPRSRP